MEQEINGVSAEIRTFKKGEVIFREGDTSASEMFDVRRGLVGIYAGYGTDSEQLLTELCAGKTFGEMGMVRNLPRSATAVALEDGTELGVINWDVLSDYFREDSSRVIQIMQQMAARIEGLTRDYLSACGDVSGLVKERDEYMHLLGKQTQEQKNQQKRLDKYISDYTRFVGWGSTLTVPVDIDF